MRLASRSTAMLTGLGVIGALVGCIYLALTASTGLPGQQHRTFTAEFVSVGGLRVGDDVRKASVRVGQVLSIDLAGERALVTMQVDEGQQIYRDARVGVKARSALGQNFVALVEGTESAGPLPEMGKIPHQRATPPTDLDQVLSTFDRPTRRGLGGTLREVGHGVSGHSANLHDAVRHSDELLADLGNVGGAGGSRAADLEGLLHATNDLAGRFRGRDQQVASLTRNLATTLDALAVDGGRPLEDTLKAAPGTLEQVRTSLVELRTPLADLERGMGNLRPGAGALGQATPNVRGFLREAVSPLGRVEDVAGRAVPAVTSLSSLLADARPLAQRAEKTLHSAHEPTAALGPYYREASNFFTWWASANSSQDGSGHYLRITLVFSPESLMGTVPVRAPLIHRNPYPAPGEALRDRAPSLLGGN